MPAGRVFKIGEVTIWTALLKARRSVGLDDAYPMHPKNLRHLYATRLYSPTRDLVLTQRRMGHRAIQATLRYVHLALTDKGYEAVTIPSHEKDNIIKYLKQGWEWIGSTKDFIYLRKPKIK
ncbi:MAG: tyrosine-type recombinase/integrase [Nitrososphaerales archaeon]